MIQLPSGKFALQNITAQLIGFEAMETFISHAKNIRATGRIYLFAIKREKVAGDVGGQMCCSDEK